MKESQAIISQRICEVIRNKIYKNITMQIPISSNKSFSYTNFVRDIPWDIENIHLLCQATLTEKEYWLIEHLLRMNLFVSINTNYSNIKKEVTDSLKSIVNKIESDNTTKGAESNCKAYDSKKSNDTPHERKGKLHLIIRIEEKDISKKQIKEFAAFRNIGVSITLEIAKAEIEPTDNKKYIKELHKHTIGYQYDNEMLKQRNSKNSIDILSMAFCTNVFSPYICRDGKVWVCPQSVRNNNTNNKLKNGPLYRGDLKQEELGCILEQHISHLQLLLTMIVGPFSIVNLLKKHKKTLMSRLAEEDKETFKCFLNLEADIYNSAPCSYLAKIETNRRVSDRMSNYMKIKKRNNNAIKIGSMCDICFLVNKYDFTDLIAKHCDTKTLDNAFYLWANIVSRKYSKDEKLFDEGF